MIFITLKFPAGRWHATAWGSHVNEGIPEWPPCPWRICRALIAAWHWKHRKNEDVLLRLIEKLAEHPPDYLLPKASAAHTRHYMPVNEGRKEIRTKIFDTFVHVDASESLQIRWPVDLDEPEQALLSTLLGLLNYLGRAESLIVASLSSLIDAADEEWTALAEKNFISDGEPIRLLAPDTASSYSAWLRELGSAGAKVSKKKKKDPVAGSLFQALQSDTADWKKEGWSLPPGARWLEYLRPRDCLRIAPRGFPHKVKRDLPTVARFALVCKVPPSVTQALSLSERFHQSLCKGIPSGKHSTSITGQNVDGSPLTGNGHTYYLPECDKHGYITHMTLHARDGFDELACRSFGKLRKVWGSEGFDVKIVLLATGTIDDFKCASPYFQSSKVWRSMTPFVPVRHAKTTRGGVPKIDDENGLQIGSPEHDCWRLVNATAPQLRVQKVAFACHSHAGGRICYELRDIPCLDFQRQRRTGDGARAGNRGYALQIEFEKEECLPYGFGYGGHFGLGVFFPVNPSTI